MLEQYVKKILTSRVYDVAVETPLQAANQQIEAMAQLGGIAMLDPSDEAAKNQFFFGGIEGCRFRKPVVPGDTVHFHVKLSNKRPPVWKYWAEAMVDGKKVAEAEIGAMLMNERGA